MELDCGYEKHEVPVNLMILSLALPTFFDLGPQTSRRFRPSGWHYIIVVVVVVVVVVSIFFSIIPIKPQYIPCYNIIVSIFFCVIPINPIVI